MEMPAIRVTLSSTPQCAMCPRTIHCQPSRDHTAVICSIQRHTHYLDHISKVIALMSPIPTQVSQPNKFGCNFRSHRRQKESLQMIFLRSRVFTQMFCSETSRVLLPELLSNGVEPIVVERLNDPLAIVYLKLILGIFNEDIYCLQTY